MNKPITPKGSITFKQQGNRRKVEAIATNKIH